VEWLDVAGDPDVWRSLGLVVADDGVVPLVGTSIRIVAPDDRREDGIVGWALSGVEASLDDTLIDGLPTEVVAEPPLRFAGHELGASGLDHVVVMTHDLLRTTAAISGATGCELKRVREVGSMKQGFHRIGRGGLIVEVVERPEVAEGPAQFWGVVLNVDDLDAACERIGPDRVSAPKDAVQPGRRIATIDAGVGLGLPVALMTPELRAT
jgi:predicted enzyme related to lactoylglutathione lyase